MVTAVPPKSTCEPATKLFPEIVSVYAPAAKLVGLTLLSVGAVFNNVTLLLPLAFASAAAVPRIVIELGLGSVAGATYFPAASIVPTEALPPTVPFTDHCTVWFVLPETIAVKVCEEPVRMLAVPGTTLTEIAATGGEDAPVDGVTAQPEANLKIRSRPRQRDSLRKVPSHCGSNRRNRWMDDA